MTNLFVGPMFEIVAGPNRTKFLAHARVLEKSDKLRATVQGKWKDSTEHKIVLEDWDPETVGRLLEWLYTGDYDSPFPTEVPQPGAEGQDSHVPESLIPTEVPQPGAEGGESPVSEISVPSTSSGEENNQSTPKHASVKRSRSLMALASITFNKADPELRPSHAEAFDQWATKFLDRSRALDFEAALLAHAKLYALADYMLLPTLQAQIFQRFRNLLFFICSGVTVLRLPLANTPVIGNLITLIRYVYANVTRLESEKEPLQDLISTFIALHYDHFDDKGGEVLQFMKQGGDFQRDLHEKVRRNEIALKEEVLSLKEQLRDARNSIRELQLPTW